MKVKRNFENGAQRVNAIIDACNSMHEGFYDKSEMSLEYAFNEEVIFPLGFENEIKVAVSALYWYGVDEIAAKLIECFKSGKCYFGKKMVHNMYGGFLDII